MQFTSQKQQLTGSLKFEKVVSQKIATLAPESDPDYEVIKAFK